MKKKKKKKFADIGLYMDVDWQKEYRTKYLQGIVKLHLYKGKILLTVDSETDQAKALGQHAGLRLADNAWMRVEDIDALQKILREARRVLKTHEQDIARVANCVECRKGFASVCDRHRALFKKYKKPKESRGLR